MKLNFKSCQWRSGDGQVPLCKAEIIFNMKHHEMEAVSDIQKLALMCHLCLIPQFLLTKSLYVKRARFVRVESEKPGNDLTQRRRDANN